MDADAAKWAQLKASGLEQLWTAGLLARSMVMHSWVFHSCCSGCQAGTAFNSWLAPCSLGFMLQLLTFMAVAAWAFESA